MVFDEIHAFWHFCDFSAPAALRAATHLALFWATWPVPAHACGALRRPAGPCAPAQGRPLARTASLLGAVGPAGQPGTTRDNCPADPPPGGFLTQQEKIGRGDCSTFSLSTKWVGGNSLISGGRPTHSAMPFCQGSARTPGETGAIVRVWGQQLVPSAPQMSSFFRIPHKREPETASFCVRTHSPGIYEQAIMISFPGVVLAVVRQSWSRSLQRSGASYLVS